MINRFRALKTENGEKCTAQNLGFTVDAYGYIVSYNGKPMWSKDKLKADNIAHDEVSKYKKINSVPPEYQKYVWKVNEVVNGNSFVAEELCDEKTEKYINVTAKNIGYIDCVSGYEEALDYEGYKLIKTLKTDNVFFNTSEVELLELERDGHNYFGLQYSIQTAVDDYVIITHILSKKPNNISDTVNILATIDEIKHLVFMNRWEDYFKCWECGNKTHWIDAPDKGIVNKYNAKKESYCGC